MTKEQRARIAAELGGIIGMVTKIDRNSKEDEYTDTDEVWTVFYQIKADARRALRILLAAK